MGIIYMQSISQSIHNLTHLLHHKKLPSHTHIQHIPLPGHVPLVSLLLLQGCGGGGEMVERGGEEITYHVVKKK